MLAISPSCSRLVARDAVADHVVGRDAERFRVAAIDRRAGAAPWSRMNSRAGRARRCSRPGLTWPSACPARPASWPARRMPSNASASRNLIDEAAGPARSCLSCFIRSRLPNRRPPGQPSARCHGLTMSHLAQNFDPGVRGQPGGVGRIEVGGSPKRRSRSAGSRTSDRAEAGFRLARQVAQMPHPARGDAVGELGRPSSRIRWQFLTSRKHAGRSGASSRKSTRLASP